MYSSNEPNTSMFLAKNFPTLDKTPSAPSAARTAELVALAADSLRGSGRLRLGVLGESMLPTLWPDDVVEIARCSVDDVRRGEIVLALRNHRFFLHRFLARSKANGFLLRGDSMPAPDPEFPKEALLGRLVSRAGQNQNRTQRQAHSQAQARTRPFLPLRPWSRAIGQLLCYCGPARRLVLKLHGRRTRDARDIQNAEGAAHLGTIDMGAS